MTPHAVLQGRRADAFRLLVAPQLRGEGNWPKPALYSAAEFRVFFSCDAALTSLPFWRKVSSFLLGSLARCCISAQPGLGSKFGAGLPRFCQHIACVNPSIYCPRIVHCFQC